MTSELRWEKCKKMQNQRGCACEKSSPASVVMAMLSMRTTHSTSGLFVSGKGQRQKETVTSEGQRDAFKPTARADCTFCCASTVTHDALRAHRTGPKITVWRPGWLTVGRVNPSKSRHVLVSTLSKHTLKVKARMVVLGRGGGGLMLTTWRL